MVLIGVINNIICIILHNIAFMVVIELILLYFLTRFSSYTLNIITYKIQFLLVLPSLPFFIYFQIINIFINKLFTFCQPT